jgi:integrase
MAEFVAALVAEGYARGTIRKTLQTLAMVLDDAGVSPNPARDKHVRLPREEPEEINPPTAAHLEAVYRLLPSKHRLPFLFLDWSGARVSAIDQTLVFDYDEPRRRVRLRAATTKTRKALWIDLHPTLADALEQQLGPREDRNPEARLFAGSGADALRTSIAKACRAAGVPLFSPHDLRHRRISLLHLRCSLGPDRRVRGTAESVRDGGRVQPRTRRRNGARLREPARLRPHGADPGADPGG